jgi:2,4-dienoyl-CoA reductase-like NADH-dependent reductase (Old Yellow Enzyme family)
VSGQPSVFEPTTLGKLELRNRVIKAATFEGMSPGGMPSAGLVDHHRRLAAGGVGMTTVAYCAVSQEGRTFSGQICMEPEVVTPLRVLTDAVHAEGGAASIQLAHCGFFTRFRDRQRRPRGPSRTLNLYGIAVGLPFADAMDEADIEAVVEDFGRAAGLAKEAGFDAIELHLGHGYLLSQFISPATNRRRDRFGGSLENRMRLPLAVLGRVRKAVGDGFPLLAKINVSDGFPGGLEVEEAVDVARMLEAAAIDAVVTSGGFTSRTPFFLMRGERPLRAMIAAEESALMRVAMRLFGSRIVRAYPFSEMFFLEQARRIRAATKVPVGLLGGLVSRENLEQAMAEGFDFVVMGRALIADPDLVSRMRAGEASRTRCDACNECVGEMEAGGVRCVLDGPRA